MSSCHESALSMNFPSKRDSSFPLVDFFRPVNETNRTSGWAVAHYLVGNAARLDIRTVIFDDRIWTAGRDEWRDYDPPESEGSQVILEHRDHVHVDVFG